MNAGFVLVMVLIVAVVVLVARQPDPARRARILRRSAFGLMAAFTLFFGAFVIGDAFTDPGGWRAAGLVASWLVPLAALGAVVWWRPGWGVVLTGACVAATIAMSVWFALEPKAWSAFEDRNGPIRTIVVFALAAAVALLGLKRTFAAGTMLIVLGIAPMLISAFGSGLGMVALSVASSPAFVAGVLYVIAAIAAGPDLPPRTVTPGAETRAA